MAARPRFTSRQQAFSAALAMSRAIDRHSPARIAAACGVQPPTVTRWTFCPEQHVQAVAAAAGVPARELRPDLFPTADAPRNDAEQATATHLAAARHFALTGRTLSSERH